MVTAGCMALCIQIDKLACEAWDNYRGVGGDESALFLPSPQIFGWLEAWPGSGSCWRLLWQRQLTELLSFLLSSGAGAAAGCCGAASCIPRGMRCLGYGTGRMGLRWQFLMWWAPERLGAEDCEGEENLWDPWTGSLQGSVSAVPRDQQCCGCQSQLPPDPQSFVLGQRRLRDHAFTLFPAYVLLHRNRATAKPALKEQHRKPRASLLSWGALRSGRLWSVSAKQAGAALGWLQDSLQTTK